MHSFTFVGIVLFCYIHIPLVYRKRLLACFTVICMAFTAGAQPPKQVDSLQQLINDAKNNGDRALYMAALANIYATVNPEKAIALYNKAYVALRPVTANNNGAKATIAANLSSMYQSTGDSLLEANWLDTAVNLGEHITDAEALSTIYSVAANHYSIAEDYARAINYSQKLLLLGQQTGQQVKVAGGYVNMGNLYFKMGQQATAIQNYKKALAIQQMVENVKDSDEYKQNVEGAYIGLSQVYFEMARYDSTLYYAGIGIMLAIQRNDLDAQCIFLNVKAYALQKLNRYKESLPYARQALQIASANNIEYHLPNAWAGLAMGYAHTGFKDSALLYGNRTEELVTKISQGKEDLVDVYTMWSSIYEGVGDYKKAWTYKQKELEAYKAFRDNEVNKAINNSDIAFGTRQKEQQIETLHEITRRQRITQWAIAVGLVITVIAAIGFWLSYRNKRRAAAILEQSNKEKEIFLKEIHHRVKNNLQIISSLLYLQFKDYKDDKMVAALQQAQQRIKSMALVHNKLYEKQDVVHVYLKEYINDLASGILASNNPGGKDIHVSVEEKSDMAFSLDTSISIGLILNEIITNSCKYAFTDKAEGNILISLEKNGDNRYKLHIADDGNGLPGDFEKKNSLGVRLVKNLARQMGGEASFASVNGTTVTVLFSENAAA